MTKHSKEEKLKAFSQLLDVVDTLREQCPWDSAQTNESIRPNTIEETMELAEALIAGEPDHIRKDLCCSTSCFTPDSARRKASST